MTFQSPLSTSAVLIIVGVLALLSVLTIVLWNSRREATMGAVNIRLTPEEFDRFVRDSALDQSTSDTKSVLGKIIGEKKVKFLKLPTVAFHYVDKETIKTSYDDRFNEPTVASMVSEKTGNTSAELKANLPQVLESRIGGQEGSKLTSTLKLPEISLTSMYLRYQRETIQSNQVTLGLEEVDIELSELKTFDGMIDTLARDFGLEIDDTLLAKQRDKIKAKAAERTLRKLEQATGAVLIEGRFRIEDAGNFYRCVYLHPVNEYLPSDNTPVTISTIFPKDLIEPKFAGNYAQSIGRLIPLNVFGTVWEPIDRLGGVSELKLNPTAIFS